MVITAGYFGYQYKMDKEKIKTFEATVVLKDKTITDLQAKIAQMEQNAQSNQANFERMTQISKKTENFKDRIKTFELNGDKPNDISNHVIQQSTSDNKKDDASIIYNDLVSSFNSL
jgi:protein subunit release factor A